MIDGVVFPHGSRQKRASNRLVLFCDTLRHSSTVASGQHKIEVKRGLQNFVPPQNSNHRLETTVNRPLDLKNKIAGASGKRPQLRPRERRFDRGMEVAVAPGSLKDPLLPDLLSKHKQGDARGSREVIRVDFQSISIDFLSFPISFCQLH